MNQVQKNAKDINSRLSAMEKTVLFKRPSKTNGVAYLDAKVKTRFLLSLKTSLIPLRRISTH